MRTDTRSTNPSDRMLADRITREGDETAFRALYRRHTPALLPFVLRYIGGTEEDANDVVQETWMRAVRGLDRFRWQSSFRTWLMGIGLNQARELLRKRVRHPVSSGAGWEPSVAPPGAEVRLDLERAIAALPDGYRTVLVLHDVEGFTHPEISERLEIAVGTSRSQLLRARRALRGMLEPPRGAMETS